MHAYFSKEDRKYVQAEFDFTVELGHALRRLYGRDEVLILKAIAYYRYFNFDLDKPFLPQYDRNNMDLLRVLARMAEG